MEKLDVLIKNNVAVKESLEFWGDIDSYNENLKEFKDSLEDKLNNLKYYKDNYDLDNYAILVHSLKSEAKYLGFIKEAEVFLEHELKSKAKDKNFIDDNFNVLLSTINNIKNILIEHFNNNQKNYNAKNILIVDDSNIMLNFLESNLFEYNVIKANNGKDAISKLENNDVYAILLDLNMPTVNGFDVLEYLKIHELFEKIPVIIITGDDSPDTIKKAFSYPILDVLNKPFKEDNIKRILVEINSFYELKS